MEATGLEKGGIYRHFSSKEELAAEAFRHNLARSVKFRTEPLADIPNAVEKLRRYARNWVETPSVIPGGCPLFNTAIDSDDGNPVLRELVTRGIREWKGRLARIVEDGIARGEIRPGIEPERIANTMMATLEGSLMISRMEGTNRAMRDGQEALDTILLGIATPQKPSRKKAAAGLRN
jgi:AcrR family transcriptional regulator